MPKEFLRGILIVLMIQGAHVTSVQAQQQNVLDNGLVRVSLDQHTGLFSSRSLQGAVLRLFDAGPAFEIGSRRVSSRDAVKIEVKRQQVEDPLGQGEGLLVNYSFSNGIPNVRYQLTLYHGKPWVTAVAYLARGNYRLGDFSVIQGKVRAPTALQTRVYVNSGTAGGDSGVWPLGLIGWENGATYQASSALSVLYEPSVQDALALGFYSFFRASTSVMVQYLNPHDIGLGAVAHYYGYRPESGELRTESLLLDFGRDPLRMLDEWADAVVRMIHPNFNHDTHRGWLNTWYIYGDRTTEDEILHQAKLLQHSILPGYGITGVGLGEWQRQRPQTGNVGDNYGFGEDQVDPKLFPHGVQWLASKITGLGLHPVFGGNYAYAAPHSSIAQKHEPWIDWEDFSRLSFGYPIDFTDSRARQWLYNLAHRTREYKAVEWWADFNGGPTRGILHDPTRIMQFEDIREGLTTIRRAIGRNVAIHQFCCGPYFPYVGLADRVRVGIDAPALGDWDGFKAMARQFAANYMLHQRIWITDPDPLFVGGEYNRDMDSGPLGPDPALLREIRMRLQEQVISGGPVTIGENVADFTPERFHLLTFVLPIYGEAARPVDMFMHSTPEIYDLGVSTHWDRWHVLLVQNWNDTNRTYEVRFSSLGLDSNVGYLVFRFWDQHLLGEFRDQVNLDVDGQQGQAYAIRSVPTHPWILSTDMHLTQGGVELRDIRYDESAQRLSGEASRHPGDLAHVVVYAPDGYTIRSASGPYRVEPQSSGAAVVYLELKFDQRTVPWSINFGRRR